MFDPTLVTTGVAGAYGGTKTVIIAGELELDKFDVPYILTALT